MTTQDAIRELRKAYDESQQYFATRLKISMSSLAYYEIGVRHPDLTAVLKFERAAEDIGREDLVKIFSRHAAAELGRFALQADDELQFQQLREVQQVLKVGSVDAGDERFQRLHAKLMDFFAALEGSKTKRGKRKETK